MSVDAFFDTNILVYAAVGTPEHALEWIEQWLAFPCQPIDDRLVRIAIEESERSRISYWDAAILAAADSLGATTVYSEDLSHGQSYGAVRVVNPFAG